MLSSETYPHKVTTADAKSVAAAYLDYKNNTYMDSSTFYSSRTKGNKDVSLISRVVVVSGQAGAFAIAYAVWPDLSLDSIASLSASVSLGFFMLYSFCLFPASRRTGLRTRNDTLSRSKCNHPPRGGWCSGTFRTDSMPPPASPATETSGCDYPRRIEFGKIPPYIFSCNKWDAIKNLVWCFTSVVNELEYFFKASPCPALRQHEWNFFSRLLIGRPMGCF